MKTTILLLLLLILALPLCALASDITDANYKGNILASNNSTLAVSVSANVAISTADLINAGILNAAASDVAARDGTGADIPFMPGYLTNPWVFYLPSIAAYSSSNVYLYTSASGGNIVYFPSPTGMSVTDNDTALEPGNNFDISLDGYINTDNGSGKNLVRHYDTTNGGVDIFVSPTVSQNVTARLITIHTAASQNMTPDAAGTYTNIPNANPAVAHYLNVDDAPGTPDDIATVIWSAASTTAYLDTYNLTGATITGTNPVITVTVYFRGEGNGGATCKAQPCLYLGAVSTNGTEISLANGVYTTYSETLTRPGGGSWSASDDWANLQCGVRVKGDGSHESIITQVYVQVNYTYETYTDVSVTGIPSGEYLTRFIADGANMWLQVGSTPSANVSVDSIPNSTANWTIGSDTGTPYIESASISINGTLVSAWAWEYGAIFHDSVNDNDGTPNFRTTSSDSDVTASLTSFLPVEQAAAEYNPDLDWPSMITALPEQPVTAYTDNTTPGVFFAGLIHTLFTHTDIPESFFWYNFTFFTVIAAGILTFRMHPSLLLKVIASGAIMIFWALPGPNVYGMFVVIYYGLFCFGVIVLAKHYGW